MHPTLFSNVTRQITRPSGGELQAAESAAVLLSAVGRDLFRGEITWGKVREFEYHLIPSQIFALFSAPSQVVALFAIAGGLAVDCVRQDHPEYLPKLVEGMADVIEDELVAWINENGGWAGLNQHVSPENSQFSYVEWTALAIGCAFSVFVLYFMLRFLGYHIISCLMWIR